MVVTDTLAKSNLADTVKSIRPFVPARDFPASVRFYTDLGFQVRLLGNDLAEMSLGPYSFLLQNYFVKEWADNFMMHMLITDLDGWWKHIDSLDLPARHGVRAPKAPKLETWGLNVAYVFDPAGVLWHIAEVPVTKP